MPRSTPKSDLTAADLRLIQVIWQAFDFEGLQIFFGNTELTEIYPKLHSKALFWEWTVYTIIFQAHLMYRYENIVQIPGIDRRGFLGLCDKFNITLQDSEQFASDRAAVGV